MSTNTPPEEVTTPPSEGPKTDSLQLRARKIFKEWWSGYNLSPNEAYTAEEKASHMEEAFLGGAIWASESIAHHEASKEKEETPPQPEGVFKGAQGLQELHDCDSFWERQMYGTRFYFGEGGLSYLHRGVLRAFLEDYALAKSRAESAEAQFASLKEEVEETMKCLEQEITQRDKWLARYTEAKSALRSLQSEIIAQHKADMKTMEEKPWAPKFKVGDRVKIRRPFHRRDNGVKTVCEVNYKRRRYLLNDNSEATWPEDALESYVWTLPAPPEGQQWHRDDWTQEMLPDGWRPLLKGEEEHDGAEEFLDGQWAPCRLPYVTVSCPWDAYTRTRRPLPKRVPLEASDVPPGSVICSTKWNPEDWCHVVAMGRNGLSRVAGDGIHFMTFDELAADACWQIKRPNEDWQACSKEES